MTLILAEFRDPAALVEAARRARADGLTTLDAHTPFRVEGLADVLPRRPSRVRLAMLIAGLGMAAAAFALQWYSAVIDYPLDVGARPLNSWQAFVIPAFEVGVLAAAVAGVVVFLFSAGLPRPHQPIFAASGFERASQDRFFLSVGDPGTEPARVAGLLDGLGAVSLRTVEP